MHKNKKKYKINWKFSQKGNLWKIIFAGNEIICGETRNTVKKESYFFSVDVKTGKSLLKNYVPEKDNFWITLEDASSKYFFLSRFEQPGMPNHSSIIAVDLKSGNKIWENTELEFFYNTEDMVIAYKQNFESAEIYELNAVTGEVIKKHTENMYGHFYKLREKIISEKYNEINDYPVSFSNNSSNSVKDVLNIEIKNTSASNPEFIERDDKVIFNYYRDKSHDLNNINKKNFSNIICIYDKSGLILYKDILNESTSYKVPDNFFTKDEYLYYIKEKNELINIKL
ncbi:MAG: DUF4905 domain-containing protein [Ignavibacteria bacterium]|nr:DUF4905 domain-containing protein [Ignavibacteria bacterium]